MIFSSGSAAARQRLQPDVQALLAELARGHGDPQWSDALGAQRAGGDGERVVRGQCPTALTERTGQRAGTEGRGTGHRGG
ncbi:MULTISPECIES: hypothetical protein [Streptomyces]|uniref:Uncharacterized protein n=1 Tax=Streptomyces noursei TaxID=1971 RepID=A0A2N8PDE6_STRNR|nr:MULTISPECIES: hypothetical protein [Streptomyces]PNE39043.1 hypothetical protein AOB60_34560 [Streptomyces noursei]